MTEKNEDNNNLLRLREILFGEQIEGLEEKIADQRNESEITSSKFKASLEEQIAELKKLREEIKKVSSENNERIANAAEEIKLLIAESNKQNEENLHSLKKETANRYAKINNLKAYKDAMVKTFEKLFETPKS